MKRLIMPLAVAIAAISAHGQSTNDYPLAPVDPTATLSDDYNTVILTWGCPGDVGETGGHIDVDQLKYYIFDAFGSFYAPAIAETAELSYTFDYSDLDKQDFMAYQLTAGVGEWYSLPVNSNIVCVGAPQELPFEEGLSEGRFDYVWCIDPASGYRVDFKIDKTDSADGDGSCMLFQSVRAEEEYGIISVKIALGEATAPTLSVGYKAQDSDFDVLVSADGGAYALLGTPEAGDGEWLSCSLPLDAYKGSKYVQVEIWARFATATSTLRLDAITVTDTAETPDQPGGIQGVTTDSQAAEYYTLDGLRVDPQHIKPGLYVKRQGASSSKVVVR